MPKLASVIVLIAVVVVVVISCRPGSAIFEQRLKLLRRCDFDSIRWTDDKTAETEADLRDLPAA